MSLKSVNNILNVLQIEAKLQEQPFQRLLKFWSQAVGPAKAAHSRPLYVQRDVLRVATSSAAWAQNLTFERQRLLLKLNEKLEAPLVDIRFSTAGWQLPKQTSEQQTISLRQHPSYVGDRPDITLEGNVTPVTTNPNTAFESWAKKIQQLSHNLPLCPECHCPAPRGELERWCVCSLCAAKQFFA